MLCVSPPGFRLQVFNLVSVPLESNSEVDGVVRRFKHAEHTGVIGRIRILHVDDLEGHLEASSSFVTPKLDPQFITRDTTFMPGETVYPVYSIIKLVHFYLLVYMHVVFVTL